MKGKIVRDDFLKNRILTNIKINVPESLVAFMVHRACLEINDYEKQVWVLDQSSQERQRLNLIGTVKDYTWNDTKLIYLTKDDDGDSFYIHDIENNTSSKLLSMDMNVNRFFFKNNRLFFTSVQSLIDRQDRVLEGCELPFYMEGRGIFAEKRNSLYEYNIDTSQIRAVSENHIYIDDIAINSDKSSIAYIGYDIDSQKKVKSSIYLFDTESLKTQIISNLNELKITYVEFLKTDTVIFTGTDLNTAGRNENQQIYLINLNNRQLKQLTKGLDLSNEEKAVTTDARFCISRDVCVYDNEFYFLAIEDRGTCLYKINELGDMTKLSDAAGTIDSYTVAKNYILFIGLRGDGMQEIYHLIGDIETKLTDFNDWLLQERIISKPEYMCIEKKDGTKIDGWVVKPVDYLSGNKYPGILKIHGGPKMIFTDIYGHDVQALAAEGYFVFFCNPRGSDGKGNAFADIRGNFSSYAYEDLMLFTDEVIERYQNLDSNRLGVTGGSYGGYMTNYLVSQTDRFSAAVSERGISNLISTFSTSDIGYQYTINFMGNNPWDDMKTFIEESPITYANRIKTPMLFLHGKDDFRCHYTESLQMYSAIKYFGTEAKLCVFEDESHALPRSGKPMSKRKRYIEIISWFDKHLKEAN